MRLSCHGPSVEQVISDGPIYRLSALGVVCVLPSVCFWAPSFVAQLTDLSECRSHWEKSFKSHRDDLYDDMRCTVNISFKRTRGSKKQIWTPKNLDSVTTVTVVELCWVTPANRAWSPAWKPPLFHYSLDFSSVIGCSEWLTTASNYRFFSLVRHEGTAAQRKDKSISLRQTGAQTGCIFISDDMT